MHASPTSKRPLRAVRSCTDQSSERSTARQVAEIIDGGKERFKRSKSLVRIAGEITLAHNAVCYAFGRRKNERPAYWMQHSALHAFEPCGPAVWPLHADAF